jgi:hypothetical protein
MAVYTFTEDVYQGFIAPGGITITISGLPANTNWQPVLVSQKITADGTETFTYNLQVQALTGAATGEYILTLTGTAQTPTATITHTTSTFQLSIIT